MAIWHRIFGTLLMDRCRNSTVQAQLELDTSQVRQLLDCLLLYAPSHLGHPSLPDGFEPLSTYTLISFKSHQDIVNDFALRELIAHGIGYQKYQETLQKEPFAPKSLTLVMISARYPRALAQKLPFTKLGHGIYSISYGLTPIRLLVTSRMRLVPHNAPLLAVSAEARRIAYAASVLSEETDIARGMLSRALKQYKLEGLDMPYTLEDAKRELIDFYVSEATPEQRLKGLAPEELSKRLSPEQRLKGLAPEQRLKGLPPDQRLQGLTQQQLLELAQQLNAMISNSKPT